MGIATDNDTKAVVAPKTDLGKTSIDCQAILQLILDYMPSGMSLFDQDLQMIACNEKFKELLGFPDDLFAKGLPSMESLLRFNALRGEYGPGDPDEITAAALQRARKMQPHVFERTRPDGSVLEIRGTPLPEGGFVTIYTDISVRKQVEKALEESDAELRLLVDNVPAMILYVDKNLHCTFANQRYADFFGFARAELLDKHLCELVGDEAYAEIEGLFRQTLAGQATDYQRVVQHRSGEQRWIEVKLVPHEPEQGQVPGCYAMATDITERKASAERIQHLANHDSLTGLPNRLLFNERLSQEIGLARRDSLRFALFFLDLDHFKAVNDTFGHNVGDLVLKNAAKRIRSQLRSSDTVARMGGDEFTIILRDIGSPENVVTAAEKIIAALSSPFHIECEEAKVCIGASIGIVLYPDNTEEHDTLLKLADTAMYDAKTRGNCYFISNIHGSSGACSKTESLVLKS
ncbi:MAG TPA: diguanylate cyclase [Gammaproteobacteria bacterium]|nr:diguanylate cyclase [Gammaproteobacteria bacterium]